MKDLIEVAHAVEQLLAHRAWKFCFIGGLAVQQWGEPRVTRDVDISLFTGVGCEEHYVEELLQHFQPRIADCRDFALRNRVVLLRSGDRIGIDIALACLPFEEQMIQRACKVNLLPKRSLTLCSAEDLIVLKAFAGRAIDWHDVETVVARQGIGALDWGYIQRQLKPLAEAKEDPDILTRLARVRGR